MEIVVSISFSVPDQLADLKARVRKLIAYEVIPIKSESRPGPQGPEQLRRRDPVARAPDWLGLFFRTPRKAGVAEKRINELDRVFPNLYKVTGHSPTILTGLIEFVYSLLRECIAAFARWCRPDPTVRHFTNIKRLSS